MFVLWVNPASQLLNEDHPLFTTIRLEIHGKLSVSLIDNSPVIHGKSMINL